MDLYDLNTKLGSQGLPPLTKLGSSSNGEYVVEDVLPNTVVVPDLFTIATLLVKDPKTMLRKIHLLMFDRKDACILAVVVNDEYLITVTQHRLPWMRFLEELPRGWLSHEGPGSEPFQILQREVPNLQKLTTVTQVVDRGKYALDTSWRTGKVRIQIVRVQSNEPIQNADDFQAQLRQGSGKVIKAKVRKLSDVRTQLEQTIEGTNEQDWLQDLHSHAGLQSLFSFLDKEKSAK